MDPELRYGRAYVPRTNYSYITTTNLARNRSKPSTRAYSQPPELNRDWTPSTTNWMPKRDWYYGAYEDLYAPSSSLKSRLKTGETGVSLRRLNDDINYELNRFKPPKLPTVSSFPVKKHKTWEHDDWQDKMDVLYPYTQNLSYRDQMVKDNYSGTRLSRRAAYNDERLNDLNYDYNILRRGTYLTPRYSKFYSQGHLNYYPGLPRGSIYTPISSQPSLYDDVGAYMFPSLYPRPTANNSKGSGDFKKPMKDLAYLDPHEDWLKTMSHGVPPYRRSYNFPEPPRSRSYYEPNWSGASFRPRPDYPRGKSYSPIRAPVKSYPAPSYPAYQKTPLRDYSYDSKPYKSSYRPEPSSDYTPKPRKITYDDEPRRTARAPSPTYEKPRRAAREPSPVYEKPRRAAREPSPVEEKPARVTRQPSRPEEDEEKPKTRPRFEPDLEEPSLEKRRIPSVKDQEPEEEPKPAAKRPSVASVNEVTPTPSPRPSVGNETEAPEGPPAGSLPSTPRRSVTEMPKSKTPAPAAATPRSSAAPTPRESTAETPRASVARTPLSSDARTPLSSVARTPRESVAETPRESVSSQKPVRPNDGAPKASVADEPKAREPSPAPSEGEVFEEAPPADEDREATPVPEPEEEAPADGEEEEAPLTPKAKLKRNTSEEFVFDDEAAETAPVNGNGAHADEEFEWGDENQTTKVTKVVTGGATTITKTTTTRTETTYEEEEVEEYEETIEENGADEPSQLEYGEEEDLNAQSIKERGFSRENSTDSQVNGGADDEEEE